MNTSSSVLVATIYTLTPTHCGTGSTSGAVDLPIARESHTQLPILPASGIKGSLRSRLKNEARDGSGGLDEQRLKALFGPDVQSDSDGLSAGALAFTEGHLLVYPIRTLSHPWLYVTAPFLLDRVNREYRAITSRKEPLLSAGVSPEGGQVLTANPALEGKPLMLEDFLYPGGDVNYSDSLQVLVEEIASLLPEAETETLKRLKTHLVLISDGEFIQLLQHAIPVQARIKLNERKTTTDDGGNLWYEEQLPSDCLFTSFVLPRPGSTSNQTRESLSELEQACTDLRFLQLGGNETVGQGLCWWRLHSESSLTSRGARGTATGNTGGGSQLRRQDGRQGQINRPPGQRLASPPTWANSKESTSTVSKQKAPLSLTAERQRFLYEKLKSTHRKSVLTELSGLPVQLRQSGLNVTLLDLLRRGGPARTVADWLTEWLMVKSPALLVPTARVGDTQPLVERCLQANRDEYQALQAEAGLLLVQAKQLAQSLSQ